MLSCKLSVRAKGKCKFFMQVSLIDVEVWRKSEGVISETMRGQSTLSLTKTYQRARLEFLFLFA